MVHFRMIHCFYEAIPIRFPEILRLTGEPESYAHRRPVWTAEQTGAYFLILDYDPPLEPDYPECLRENRNGTVINILQFQERFFWEQAIANYTGVPGKPYDGDDDGGTPIGATLRPVPPSRPGRDAKPFPPSPGGVAELLVGISSQ